MDASVVTTTSALDPAQLVGFGISLARALGAPGVVVGVLVLIAIGIWGVRAIPWSKAERAPEPLSDGGAAADRDLPPAQAAPPVPRDLRNDTGDSG